MKKTTVRDIIITEEMWEYIGNITQCDLSYDRDNLIGLFRHLEGKGKPLSYYQMCTLIDMGLNQLSVSEKRTITIKEERDANRVSEINISMTIECGNSPTRNYYTVYAEKANITYIMCDDTDTETGEVFHTDCVTWHFGCPEKELFQDLLGYGK